MNKQQTLVSTVMRADNFGIVGRKTLEALSRRLCLDSEVAGEFNNSLQLSLGNDRFGAYEVEAKVLTNERGMPYLRLEIVGHISAITPDSQRPTWTIEQRGSRNVLHAVFLRPKLWSNEQLTLDEEVRPDGFPVNSGDRMLLNHMIEQVHRLRRHQN